MKNYSLALCLLLIVSACKQNKETIEINETTDYTEEKLDVTTTIYPENITKVFEAHGGIDNWNQFQTLDFTMKKETGDEITITDLKNRRSHISTSTFAIGYTGENVWLEKKDGNEYNGNPNFYYNLMFYFYAMPFILADDGIVYTDVEPLKFEGKDYPGIKISYNAGVGESPEDEYILYYNPETYKMEWLGYTVTYFSKEKSKKWSFIKYSNWQTVEGLVLPETLTWYKVENNMPVAMRNDLKFTAIKLSKDKLADAVFAKPETAEIVE